MSIEELFLVIGYNILVGVIAFITLLIIFSPLWRRSQMKCPKCLKDDLTWWKTDDGRYWIQCLTCKLLLAEVEAQLDAVNST